jgi:hypothetical protein
MDTDKGLLERIRMKIKLGINPAPIVSNVRESKHLRNRKFRATKAYADDRQKALHNRRKNGLRRRRN